MSCAAKGSSKAHAHAVVEEPENDPQPKIAFEEIKRGVENLCQYLNEQLEENDASIIVDSLQETIESGTTLRIGFLGNRGVGKTTLLNRLLRFDLLPTGDFSAITASTTEIIGTEADKFLAIVYFINKSDWEQMVTDATEDLKSLREAEDEDIGEAPSVIELHSKLNGLWQPDGEENEDLTPFIKGSVSEGYVWENSTPLELVPEQFRSILLEQSSKVSKEFEQLSELRDFLVNFTHRVDGAAWPLVRKISIFGPFKLLTENGFSLVDIPGSGDM